ncbi:MAG TPA: DUF5681 domain-containing protein [Geminicoccus sp.]|jgi:hypothetical protein|uniref:DUF5681 domain-containing protein n=1 Tax=Geminicoccus sp. TaxID=2024832 RepID=UPI002E3800BE|nr:DUF5681 domain-containing protein [Geminicoccus sp.]HEX2528690.1 DUF5681 domain-containing protein [Geminicoccus sp.]
MADEPAKSGPEQGQGRFRKGRSGNPRGRPKGSRNRVSLALDAIAEQEAEAVLRAAIRDAQAGDTAAQRAILDRIWPVRKGRPVRLDLPAIHSAQDVAQGMTQVIAAMAAGQLSPDEAQAVVAVLERRQRVVELVELEARIAALEQEGAA